VQVFGQKKVAGSIVGGRADMKAMLEVCDPKAQSESIAKGCFAGVRQEALRTVLAAALCSRDGTFPMSLAVKHGSFG
jgi:hypothetical protein